MAKGIFDTSNLVRRVQPNRTSFSGVNQPPRPPGSASRTLATTPPGGLRQIPAGTGPKADNGAGGSIASQVAARAAESLGPTITTRPSTDAGGDARLRAAPTPYGDVVQAAMGTPGTSETPAARPTRETAPAPVTGATTVGDLVTAALGQGGAARPGRASETADTAFTANSASTAGSWSSSFLATRLATLSIADRMGYFQLSTPQELIAALVLRGATQAEAEALATVEPAPPAPVETVPGPAPVYPSGPEAVMPVPVETVTSPAPDPSAAFVPTPNATPGLATEAERMFAEGKDPQEVFDAMRAAGATEAEAYRLAGITPADTSYQARNAANEQGEGPAQSQRGPLEDMARNLRSQGKDPQEVFDAMRAAGATEAEAYRLAGIAPADAGYEARNAANEQGEGPPVRPTAAASGYVPAAGSGIDQTKIDALWGEYFASLDPQQAAALEQANELTAQAYDALRRELEQTGGLGTTAARSEVGEIYRGDALRQMAANTREIVSKFAIARSDALLQRVMSAQDLEVTEANLTESRRQFDASLSVQQQQLRMQNDQFQTQLGESRRQFDASLSADQARLQTQINQFDRQLAQMQSQFETSTGIQRESLAAEIARAEASLTESRRQFDGSLSVQQQQLQQSRDQFQMQYDETKRQFDASLSLQQKQLDETVKVNEFNRRMSQARTLIETLSILPDAYADALGPLVMRQVTSLVLGEDFIGDPAVQKVLAQVDLGMNIADEVADRRAAHPEWTDDEIAADIATNYTPTGMTAGLLTPEEVGQIMDQKGGSGTGTSITTTNIVPASVRDRLTSNGNSDAVITKLQGAANQIAKDIDWSNPNEVAQFRTELFQWMRDNPGGTSSHDWGYDPFLASGGQLDKDDYYMLIVDGIADYIAGMNGG